MRPLVLASTSRFRRALLGRLGLPFHAEAPRFDESDDGGRDPAGIARAFAAAKAESVAALHPEALIIGCDQVCALGDDVLRKAETPAEAEAQLARLAGRTHHLHAAVALHEPASGRTEVDLVTVALGMRPLSSDQIARYVAADRPLGSAGGYTFEGLGVALFEDVAGSDDSAIVGLPLIVLGRLLRRFGVDPLDARAG